MREQRRAGPYRGAMSGDGQSDAGHATGKRAAVLFNPASGGGRAARRAEAVAGAVRAAGVEVVTADVRGVDEAWWVGQTQRGSAGAAVVVGGDGTVSRQVPALIASGWALYHVPAGNENLLARGLGHTADPDAVVRAVVGGAVTEHDAAEMRVEGGAARAVVLMASVGPDAEVVHRFSEGRTGPRGHAGYIVPMAAMAVAGRPPAVAVSVDGAAVVSGECGVVVVAVRAEYALGMNPAARADAHDGLLDVVFLPAEGGLEVVGMAALCLAGEQWGREGVRWARGRSVRISGRGLSVQADGEPVGRNGGVAEVHLRSLPGVLRVLRAAE